MHAPNPPIPPRRRDLHLVNLGVPAPAPHVLRQCGAAGYPKCTTRSHRACEGRKGSAHSTASRVGAIRILQLLQAQRHFELCVTAVEQPAEPLLDRRAGGAGRCACRRRARRRPSPRCSPRRSRREAFRARPCRRSCDRRAARGGCRSSDARELAVAQHRPPAAPRRHNASTAAACAARRASRPAPGGASDAIPRSPVRTRRSPATRPPARRRHMTARAPASSSGRWPANHAHTVSSLRDTLNSSRSSPAASDCAHRLLGARAHRDHAEVLGIEARSRAGWRRRARPRAAAGPARRGAVPVSAPPARPPAGTRGRSTM